MEELTKEEELELKIEEAKSRIQGMLKWYAPHEVYCGHSGGKDSSTIMHLVHSVNENIPVIHNGKRTYVQKRDKVSGPTDVDIRTLEFLYQYTLNQADYITLVKTHKMKDYLKGPGKQFRVQVDGTRLDEFDRDAKSNTFEINGKQVSRAEVTHWVQNGLFGLNFLMPIFDWTSEDVFDYHKLNNIPLSEEYLDDKEYQEWNKQ